MKMKQIDDTNSNGRTHSFARRLFQASCIGLVCVLLAGCPTMRTVVIKSDPEPAAVSVNGTRQGETPVTLQVKWPERATVHKVRVEKEDFMPEEKSLTEAEARAVPPKQPWVIEFALKRTRFVKSPIRRWVFSTKGLELEEEITLSQVGEIEREPKVQSVTKMTDAKPEDAFIESRISIMPDGKRFVYSFPYRVANAHRGSMPISGCSAATSRRGSRTPGTGPGAVRVHGRGMDLFCLQQARPGSHQPLADAAPWGAAD